LAGVGAAAGSAAVGAPSSKVIDAHLAVQATIRSYQVRGHLAAQTDPLHISNMTLDAAKKLIIRSTEVAEADMDTVYQLPSTTFIGGEMVNLWF
jgi:2-oxoglutarate dehydrogenase E1 component